MFVHSGAQAEAAATGEALVLTLADVQWGSGYTSHSIGKNSSCRNLKLPALVGGGAAAPG